MYFLAQQDKQKMKDILDYLLKYNVIERASHRSKVHHIYASAGYLVYKPNPEASARLVIDYKLVNQSILTAPPVIPAIANTLYFLQDKYMFSTTDLTSAYSQKPLFLLGVYCKQGKLTFYPYHINKNNSFHLKEVAQSF